ncbi:NifB/NifX family molybdenum-iron cluster-binding protein [Halocella sp. SP3-1]|uniref:NifB/NifX family molybdenum-iron cluster-binding protein n=1 Tax=Halocella sp. SP3-1 TaxID=2382161 RepID=UPI000F75834E|nr:NifB/NifX family molybdenum-iron cluster-binding protein [Halocella sp. SP3-1]AZO94672.1 dinitrogenase iron-molybdenum cofactor biosynthesis protein [Halocella sp. SP3-1]
MKLLITCEDNNNQFKSKFDARFGRANYFAVVYTETGELEFINNSASNAAGAGVSAAQLLVDEHADGVISGKIGPKALNGLKAGGIKVYYFNGSDIEEAVKEFTKGNLIVEYDPAVVD